jgi:hypothetical protein
MKEGYKAVCKIIQTRLRSVTIHNSMVIFQSLPANKRCGPHTLRLHLIKRPTEKYESGVLHFICTCSVYKHILNTSRNIIFAQGEEGINLMVASVGSWLAFWCLLQKLSQSHHFLPSCRCSIHSEHITNKVSIQITFKWKSFQLLIRDYKLYQFKNLIAKIKKMFKNTAIG